MIQLRNKLKVWFAKGKYPTEGQFADLIDSLFHRGEDMLGIDKIEGLQTALDSKAAKGAASGVLQNELHVKVTTTGIPKGKVFPKNTNTEQVLNEALNPEDYSGNLDVPGIITARNFIKKGALSENKDIYIAPIGGLDNEMAEGTEEKPYKTLDYALLQLPPIVTAKVKFYLMDGGMVIFNQGLLNLFAAINWGKNPVLYGFTSLIRDDFVTKGVVEEFNDFTKKAYDKNGDQPMDWHKNFYWGHVVKYSNGTYGINGTHGQGQLKCAGFTEGLEATEINKIETMLLFSDNRVDPTDFFSSGKALIVNNCRVANNNGKNLNILTDSIQFNNCLIQPGKTLRIKNNAVLNSCMIITQENDTEPLISVVSGKENDLTSNLFEHLRPELLTNLKPCIRYEHGSSGRYMRNYVKGFPIGVEFEPNTHVYNCYGHYPNHFEDVGVLFNIKGSNVSFGQSEWYGKNSIRLFGVNYLFSLNGGLDNMHFVFAQGQIYNQPQEAVFVPKTGGEWREGQVKLTALKSRPDKYIDAVRQNSFYVHNQLFPEIDPYDYEIEIQGEVKDYLFIGNINQNLTVSIHYNLVQENTCFGGGSMLLTNSFHPGIMEHNRYGAELVAFSKEIANRFIKLTYETPPLQEGEEPETFKLIISVKRQII